MYLHFGLVLMVNHACNLRCSYCYAGEKFHRAMSSAIGRRAIDRAVASIHRKGQLDLGLFGGEPLLEPVLIEELIEHAVITCDAAGVELVPGLTTNGTQTSPAAWRVMTRPGLDLVISHDGLPAVHDRHRRGVDGQGTSKAVVSTMLRLLEAGTDVRVLMVVRPDTVDAMAEGIAWLRAIGVHRVEPSLDVWATWTDVDIDRLRAAIARSADIWRDGLPLCSVGWFDEKLAAVSGIPTAGPDRCGFGAGELAVAPSGNLYPCERLIGEDGAGNQMRLAGHALDGGTDFLVRATAVCSDNDACRLCPLQSICDTGCQCSNYLRTGNVARPDALLCALNQTCLEQTIRVLQELNLTRTGAKAPPAVSIMSPKGACDATPANAAGPAPHV